MAVRRVVAVVVSVCLVVAVLPSAVGAQVDRRGSSGVVLGAPPEEPADLPEPEPVAELVELRTATSRTFEMSDGSRRLELFPAPIHRQDPDSGEWVRSVGDLQAGEDGYSATTGGPVDSTLPEDLSAGSVQVTGAGGSVTVTDDASSAVRTGQGRRGQVQQPDGGPLGRIDTRPGPAVSPSIVYPEREGVSVELAPTVAGVKETLILADTQSARTFRFRLDAEGLSPSLRADGAITLDDTDGQAVWFLPAPFMLDSAEQPSRSDGVAFSLDADDPALVTVSVTDDAWVEDPARVWPVLVDPTIYATNVTTDCQLQSAHPDLHDCSTDTGVLDDANRLLFDFDLLPLIDEPVTIRYAGFELYRNQADPGSSQAVVHAYRIDEDWDPAAATWNDRLPGVAWTTPGATVTGGGVDEYATAVGSDTTWINVGRLVQEWVNDATRPTGLVLASDPGSGYYRFDLSETTQLDRWPRLYVHYEPLIGVEDFYSYTHIDLADGRTIDVNHASGNLTLTETDIDLSAHVGGSDLGVTRTYNSRYGYGTAYHWQNHDAIGAYWQMTPHTHNRLHQMVPGGKTLLRDHRRVFNYNDGTTWHSPPFIAETLTRAGDNTWTATDPNAGTTWSYSSSGYPTSLDLVGGGVAFGYDTDGRIDLIADDQGGQLVGYAHRTDGAHNPVPVETLTDPAGGVHTYDVTGYRLRSYTPPTGPATTYTWTSSTVTTISRGSETVEATYDSDKRVTSLTVTDPAGTVSTWTFDYTTPWQTTITHPDSTVETAEYGRDGRVEYEELDPESDPDNDLEPTLLEELFGASPTVADTDADGLGDGFEIRLGYPYIKPDEADTDGDGVLDGAEDPDDDGQSNHAEQAAGTDPLLADTDGDDSPDGEEATAGTDPLNPDTDGDRLEDGVEGRLGSDPLESDSDGDGVPDGQEVYSTVLPGPDGITITLEGLGDLPGLATVQRPADESAFTGHVGQISPPVELILDLPEPPDGGIIISRALETEINPELFTTTITFPIPSQASDPSDLVVMSYDPQHQVWMPAQDVLLQVADGVAGTVTAQADGLSPASADDEDSNVFALVSLSQWVDFWGQELTDICREPRIDENGDPIPVAVALVMDRSGSMLFSDPADLGASAATRLVDLMADGDRAAIIEFASEATTRRGLTGSKDSLTSTLGDLAAFEGGTDIAAGVGAALSALGGASPDDARAIVLFTDGVGEYDDALTAQAIATGTTIFPIALGNDADEVFLNNLANDTGGRSISVNSPSDLDAAFEVALDELGRPLIDTDGDGLTDCQELDGMDVAIAGGITVTYTTDPNDPDTDDDLLPDGLEIEPFYWNESDLARPLFNQDEVGYTLHSSPVAADTDEDGLEDYREFEEGANGLISDSDSDGVDDISEYVSDMNLLSGDTDADRIGDAFEFDLDNGLNPIVPDLAYPFAIYVRLWAQGFICGDFTIGFCGGDDRDTFPYLIGQIAAGLVSPVSDVRDVIGSIGNGDVVGTVFAGIGLIPFVGDGNQIRARLLDFAARNPDQAYRLAQLVYELNLSPLFRQSGAAFRADLVDELIAGADIVLLRNAGLSDQARALLLAGRVNLNALASLVEGAKDFAQSAASRNSSFLFDFRDGEQHLRATLPAAFPTGRGFSDPSVPNSRRNYRIIDAYSATSEVALESKVGYVSNVDFALDQIRRDVELLRDLDTPIRRVEWHFFASDVSRSIGANPLILQALDDAGIPYFVHLPS